MNNIRHTVLVNRSATRVSAWVFKKLELAGVSSLESYSYHFTFPDGFLGIKLKIKMHETVFTNTLYNFEIRIFYQFFIVIINQIITSIGFNFKIDVKQLVRSWKPPSTKILN